MTQRNAQNRRHPPLPSRSVSTLIAAFVVAGLGAGAAIADPIHVLEAGASPNGRWEVELADDHIPFTYELFATDRRTGVRRKIGKPTGIYEDVIPGFVISGNSQRVIYSQRNSALGTDRQLYSAAIDGSNWIRISPPMVPGGGVEPGFRLIQDGMNVHYLADPYVDEQYSWFVVSVGGGETLSEIFSDDFESSNTAAWG